MSNNKSLQDRILAVQQACTDDHVCLEFFFVDGYWHGAVDDVDVSEPSETFEGMIESLEAEMHL